jgi:DNA-binding NtrC family response regulator
VDEPIRILLIEDNLPDAELLERALCLELKVSLQRVDRRESFRAALEAFKPHVILSDSTIPGFDGLEALELARELAPETPFIFVSGRLDEDRTRVALQRGAKAYLDKDHQDRIVAIIAHSLEGHNAAR